MLYEILKTSKLGASFAPDMYTALWAQKLARDGEVKTLSGIPPLTFRSNGQPLLDYLISGNTVQTGTPTHESPIMPNGTGERTGNLAPPLTDWVDGYITDAGIVHASTDTNREKTSDYISVKAGAAYTFSIENGFPDSPWRAIGWYAQDKTFISRASGNSSNAIYTNTPSNAVYCRLSYRTQGRTTNPMFNLGLEAIPYEPYGYKIPISSANTITPVYLGEVRSTRRIKKLVLTGEESFFRDREREGSWRFYSDALISAKDNTAICSHFENIGSDGVNNSDNIGFCIFYRAQFGCRFPKSIAATVADFKSYLAAQYAAGTPVTVWYVLANEETGIVNEPLMRIGDYADTVSYEQAGVEIPTARGTNTIDVLTDVKPSEIYIKYKRRNNNE